MRHSKIVAALLTAVAIQGCAVQGANYVPMVDMRGRSTEQYSADLQDCQQYAATQLGAGDAAIVGAVIGALFGVALMAAGGGRGGYGNEVAAVGAIGGGLQGAASAENNQRSIISRCMMGRGWSVLQ